MVVVGESRLTLELLILNRSAGSILSDTTRGLNLSPPNGLGRKQVYRRGQLPLKEVEQVKRLGRDDQYLTHYTKALTSPPFFKEGIKGWLGSMPDQGIQ